MYTTVCRVNTSGKYNKYILSDTGVGNCKYIGNN